MYLVYEPDFSNCGSYNRYNGRRPMLTVLSQEERGSGDERLGVCWIECRYVIPHIKKPLGVNDHPIITSC